MNAVNKTLYIPLYGKAFVSRRGLFLQDSKAEEIWGAEGFSLKGKSKSKWLAYYLGIRAAVFDAWLRKQLAARPEAVVLQLGCGLDSRILRLKNPDCRWYDVDFPAVIEERKHYYEESSRYRMIGADVRDKAWLEKIPERKSALVVMEGVSMYLAPEELKALFRNLQEHFETVSLLMDCYTEMAEKMSRFKNPIHDVGASRVYGLDDPRALEEGGFRFVRAHEITPRAYIDQLTGLERRIFQKLYAGKFSKKLYQLFEYKSQ